MEFLTLLRLVSQNRAIEPSINFRMALSRKLFYSFLISRIFSSFSGESPSVDLETLKRRAERFGQSSSTTMQKLELEKKIKERESRFGKVEKPSTEAKRPRITAPNENLLLDEKMKKRAERFGVKV